MATTPRERLYKDGIPADGFNSRVLGWLRGERDLVDHATPKAFGTTRLAYDEALKLAMKGGLSRIDAHREVLSNLTALLLGVDLTGELAKRLPSGLIHK